MRQRRYYRSSVRTLYDDESDRPELASMMPSDFCTTSGIYLYVLCTLTSILYFSNNSPIKYVDISVAS